jgi:hypothetical protein
MQDTIDLIRQWFHDKGIIEKSTPLRQLSKTQEELNELRDELVTLNALTCAHLAYGVDTGEAEREVRHNVKLEMGDVFVTLFGVCEMLNLDPAECMDLAYLKISKRNGEMRDGVFVKSEDTTDPTQRDLPWGELPEPPPLPKGKVRWVNRGRFRGVEFDTGDRTVYWLNNNERWLETIEFSMDYIHIEAI